MEWACNNCPKKKYEDLHPYTHKLLRLRSLQAGGYPLDADDLTMREWIDLGWIKKSMDQPGACPMMMTRY